MINLPIELINSAFNGRLTVFLGAGVSAITPSRLPNWVDLASDIAAVLNLRSTERMADGAFDETTEEYLLEDARLIEKAFERKSLVPEYSAQIIHELAGDLYFNALSCLDAGIPNGAHFRIAHLINNKFIDSIVTTNFDQLVERALSELGPIEFRVYRDAADFDAFSPERNRKITPLLKIHGCCSEPNSMIDTLKQRKLGRQRSAEKALSRLNSEYFLFLGFSGSDLLTNPDYLGFDDLSRTVKGACYVAWPHAREIGEGAKALIGKFGTKAHVITEDVEPFLDALIIQLGCEAFAPDQCGELEDGRTLFRKKLVRWANGVSFPKALICISALLESGGEGERAARRLDRAVRRASTIENVSHPDWPLVAFHNGRAGVSLGRFVNVPDASGNESNASAYSVNSLLHGAAALGMRGTIHMPTAFLWRGNIDLALGECYKFLDFCGHLIGRGSFEPGLRFEHEALSEKLVSFGLSIEDFIDYWASAMQVYCILQPDDLSSTTLELGEAIFILSNQIGDPIRAAKVNAFRNLYLANFSVIGDVDKPSAAEAQRVGDKIALGLNELVCGRLLVGASRDKISRSLNIAHSNVAVEAARYLQSASEHMWRGGMACWAKYALIQCLKAFADQHNWKEVETLASDLMRGIHQVPALAPETLMVIGQVHMMIKDVEQARVFFEDAEYNARHLGFPDRRIAVFRRYVDASRS